MTFSQEGENVHMGPEEGVLGIVDEGTVRMLAGLSGGLRFSQL